MGPSRREAAGRTSVISPTVNAGATSAIPSTTPNRPAKLARSERVASARPRAPSRDTARPASASQGTRRRARVSKVLGRRAVTGSTRAASRAGPSAASEGRPEPRHDALHGRRQGERRAAHRDHVVEVVDGAGHEPNRGLAQQVAEAHAEQRAERGGQQRLGEDQAEELAGSRPERPQRPEDGSPLHHAEQHRVVDQEHPDHEREQAQGDEVELERGGELRDRLGLLARPDHARAGRQPARHGSGVSRPRESGPRG